MWARYLAERLEGETMGSVRPVSVVQLLEDIVKQSNINKHTIAHVRSLLSGIYTFARNHGHFDGSNPVTGQILRHGDIVTTQRFYRKVRRPKVQKAMKKLARKVGSL